MSRVLSCFMSYCHDIMTSYIDTWQCQHCILMHHSIIEYSKELICKWIFRIWIWTDWTDAEEVYSCRMLHYQNTLRLIELDIWFDSNRPNSLLTQWPSLWSLSWNTNVIPQYLHTNTLDIFWYPGPGLPAPICCWYRPPSDLELVIKKIKIIAPSCEELRWAGLWSVSHFQ